MTPFWVPVEGEALAQGDLLPNCPIPVFPAAFSHGPNVQNVPVQLGNLVVVTQSCDLENKKVTLVALCPIFTLDELSTLDARYGKPTTWEEMRKGRIEGLHMLASPDDPANNRGALVADFRQLVSLPVGFLAAHAASLGRRWRLQSPFLEHFSQAFARFFMRVGLPSSIPHFK